jgi:long-chain fatty acid transport protein
MLLFAASAFASGYYFLDSGSRGIGRGGAIIAGADDQSAQYYNPAALANIERTMINVNVWGCNQWATFDRADEPGLEPFAAVENEADPIIEPQAGVVFKLGGLHPALNDTTLAVGLYVPTAPYLSFPEEGAQRYSIKDELVWQAYAGPSIAQRLPFARWITLGAGLQYTFLRVEQSLDAVTCLGTCATEAGQPEDPEDDVALEIKAWDTMEWSGNFGLLVEPTKWMKIGASLQLPIAYEAPGTLVSDIDPESLTGQLVESTHVEDTDVNLLLTVPLIVRGGIEFNPVKPLKVEVAGNWIQWSTMDTQTITDVNLELVGKEGSLIDGQSILIDDDIVFLTGFQDAWSVRLGGDYAFNESVKVRAGGYYETAALPSSYLGQSLIDRPKFGYGVGGTFTIKQRVAIDVGFGQQFLDNSDVTDSELRQQTLIVDITKLDEPGESTTVGLGKPIGNGSWNSHLMFATIGASVFFGPGADSAPAP